jgi:hypothetical protein
LIRFDDQRVAFPMTDGVAQMRPPGRAR